MLDNVKSILFLGIGGVSMHQLALAYKSLGYRVLGYDSHESEYTRLCESRGIKVTHRFDANFMNVDCCIKTGAIKEDNKYVRLLRARNCTIIDRAEALAHICKYFKCVIAVAGTHGKSTTSSLIYEILRVSGKKVSCHIGADVFSPRFELGDDYLVVEACEYNKSFLSLYPNVSVITNIEAEHMDCYGSLFNLRTAFTSFLRRGSERFVYLEDSTKFLKRIKNIKFVTKTELKFSPKIHGEYNMKNISLAVEITRSLGIEDKLIQKTVNSFTGLPRRYEFRGKFNQSKIYIDYAHHPTEIASFIDTFSTDYKNNLIVFQPHTYSRTKLLLKEFISVLSKVNNLCIYKEYPAREKSSSGLSAHDLYLEIKKLNPSVKYSASAKSIIKNVGNVDAVAFVGAGDINKVAEKIIKSY